MQARLLFILPFLLLSSILIAVPTGGGVPQPVIDATRSSSSEIAHSLGNVFADIAEKVSPAVVIVNVSRKNDPENSGASEEFSEPMDPPHHTPKKKNLAPKDLGESQGSGFIVRNDGYIYTNTHVVQGADKIKVKLKDGRTFDATIVGTPDEKTDVALIKIHAKDLPTVTIGDSDAIRPGEWTIAIGAPFNLDYSVTVGVLSGKVRDRIGAAMYEEYLQTQATINPGNSGGPLLDIDGKVVGINTLIKTRQGFGFNFYNANVGFAIPIKLAQKVGAQLMSKGRVDRPWIGISIRNLADDPDLRGFVHGIEKGVVITSIHPDTPAYQTNLKPGDIITAIDGIPVSTARDLQRQVLEKQIGQSVRLTIHRDEKNFSVDIRTGLQPNSQANNPSRGTPLPSPTIAGMWLQPVTRELSEQFNLTEKNGLFVTDIEDDSPAARAQIPPGSVLNEVDGKKISTVNQLKDYLKKADPKRGVMIQLNKDGIRSFVILKSLNEN